MAGEITEISDIKGVGPKLAERIQQTLDVESIEQLTELTEEQLQEVKGIGSSKAEKIFSNIEDIEGLTEECDRCGKKFVSEDKCPECSTELQEKFEPIKKEIEYFKNDNFRRKRWHLEDTLEEIDSKLSEGKFKEGEELIDSAEEKLAEAQDLSDELTEIGRKLEEEKVINLSTYREELELSWEYLRYGDYEEAHNRAEKIKDYLEEEERYKGVEKSKLLEENIEEFSMHMMGVGPRAGEKIYGSGFRTLEDVYTAGTEELKEKTDIEESTAERLMNALDLLFEDIDIERGGEKEPFPEREDQKTKREEEIFKDTGIEIEEEKEKKEEEKEIPPVSEEEEKEEIEEPKKTTLEEEKEVVRKEPKKEEPMTVDELLSMEEEPIQKNEKKLKYWIPAILIPIILAIVAHVLFLM